jgi:stage V sporulation protein R
MSTQLSPELIRIREEIEGYAKEYGLDYYPVIFEVLDWKQINMVAAYGGFPNRYPHWRFGMEYEQLSKSYAYGLSKIYEMVINNDPCYAYLLHSNSDMDQKLVMAHVYGHSDFFKNNGYFAHTNRKMMDEMANHKTKVKKYIDRYGLENVEGFIDVVLSLENLIDTHGTFMRRRSIPQEALMSEGEGEEEPTVRKLKSKDYMDHFINPKEFLEDQKKVIDFAKQQKKNFPENPERDVLLFLIEHAPLERWEREVLSIIREEAYYLLPQMQTKIMNEGWASYWHSTIMTERALKPSEFIDYADHHAGTLASAPGRLNPYKVGIELFRDIEDRWNKGKFGKEYDECNDMVERKRWNKNLGLGRKKIFEVRKIHSDLTFIDTFLTQDFCREHQLFVYAFNDSKQYYEISSRDFKAIKEKLLYSLTNRGQPSISVVNANYKNRGELYLIHQHEGVDLRLDYAQETLKNLYRLWKRPAAIETVIDGTEKILYYDGTAHQELRKTAEV